jgi:hypothetical protein
LEGPDPNADATMLDWSARVSSPGGNLLVVVASPAVCVELAVSVEPTRELSPRGHDPPWRSGSPPRAPPA